MNPPPNAATPMVRAATTRLLDRALVSAFLAHVPDFVYFKDREGRFIAVSQSKVRRNGLKHEDEIIGKTDFDFFSEQDARKAKEDEDEVMRTGVPVVDKLEHIKWADGRETWSLINKMPLHDDAGAIIGTFGLTKDITAAKELEAALEKSRRELIDASRMAGMAEVATGVLHNVGNVLNSLNVSTTVITNGLHQSKTDSLSKVADLIRENRTTLAAYFTDDPKGKLVPDFITSLSQHFAETRTRLLQEGESLKRNVDHIKEIVVMQQTYATAIAAIEPMDAAVLMEDSLRMNTSALHRHAIRVVRDFNPVPAVLADRGKALQILVNLISNAKYAAKNGPQREKVITLRIAAGDTGHIQLSVTDNGEGISVENLGRIFNHGFTTKATGHGFGLHCSANAAREMKGSLTVHSDGPGTGATFVLDLPASISV
ncbi:MAG: ATP-binding protein [Lacunisphaera sp.]